MMSKDSVEFDGEDDSWMAAVLDYDDGALAEHTSTAPIPVMTGAGRVPAASPEPSTSSSIGSHEPVSSSSKKLYNVLSVNTAHNRKFDTKITELSIRLNEIEKNPAAHIKQMFDDILESELKDVAEQDKVGISLSNQSFNKPMFITLRQRDQLTSDMILAEAEKIVQSNEDFFLNEPLDVKITTVHLPHGQKGDRNLHMVPYDTYCKRRNRSIVIIKNGDNLCLPRAIVIGKAFVERLEKTLPDNVYCSLVVSERPQRMAAIKLCQDAIPECRDNAEYLRNFKGDLQEVDRFQQYLKDEFELTVFDGSDRLGKKILYKGYTKNTRYIDLFLDTEGKHYNTITSVPGAFAWGYYCRKCNKGYDHKGTHRCAGRCKKCGDDTECKPEENFNEKCRQCNIYFSNSKCLANHKVPTLEKDKSICDVTKYCYNCQQIYTLNKWKTTHKCWYKLCRTCNTYVPKDHLCHVQKLDSKEQPDPDDLFVFFDFEARVENGKHIPNFCVIQNQCKYCENESMDCWSCGPKEYIIDKEGDELLDEFFRIISNKSEGFKQVFVFAHNGGGYDFQFVVKHMIMKKNWTPKIIKNGSKIMSIEYRNLHFKDTLYFFGCKLAALPKMFDIKETVKGYFPHFFNLPENQDYVGPIPDSSYYGPDYMSAGDREKFLKWHAAQSGIFNFKEEMTKYCKADVDILRQAALKFRQLFVKLLDVDPLTSTLTIASACMKGYRKHFLPENTIGLMDFKTYHMRDNQSKMTLRYLLYLEQKYGVKLQSTYRGMEKEFGKYKVDGYYEKFPTSKLENFDKDNDTRQEVELIVEIHGCLFHGCPRCYSGAERHEPISDTRKNYLTLHHRYENTVKKMDYLRNLPSNPHVLEVWECEINQKCTTDNILREIMTDVDAMIRIESNREAFFGGRTECFRNYYRVKPGEEIRYIDVNSLYPYVNKYGVYPIGHPEIFVDDEARRCDLRAITGIAKVRILPPKRLLFPVLPIKMNNKLIFPLCRTCAQNENHGTCTHSDVEREIIGTYTCIELSKALDLGYQLQDVYEVWSYKSTQYDKATKEGGLFAGYIDKFLKIKQAASGYPSYVKTDFEKEEFCRKFREKENIDLQPNEIQPNPGMRALSKLCLNSLWGKFGQRNRMEQTTIVDKREKYTSLVINPENEISDVSILQSNRAVTSTDNDNDNGDDDIALVSWRMVEECAVDSGFINPIVSAYVTAQARLYLHSFLQRLGNRVLYCDTDSVIYIYRKGDPEIEIGSYLGEMGNELDAYGTGSYISEYVCEGPKNYAYAVVDNEGKFLSAMAKVLGFTLNYAASQKLNLSTMKEFVTGNDDEKKEIHVTEPFKIQRKRHFDIVSQSMTKKYGKITSKRRRIANYKTVPYGFVDMTPPSCNSSSDDDDDGTDIKI